MERSARRERADWSRCTHGLRTAVRLLDVNGKLSIGGFGHHLTDVSLAWLHSMRFSLFFFHCSF